MVDAGEERLVAVVVKAVLQVLEDHLVVGLRRELGVLQQRLDLAGEEQPAGARRACVVERLDAEVVAAQDELAVALAQVGDGERPHAVEARATGRAPLLVGVHDDLGVAGGAKGVAGGLELGAQLAVVVDLAVVDEPDGLVLVGRRLVAAGAVDDAQPAMAETDARALKGAGVVGTAMQQRGRHAAEQLAVGSAGETEDAAHAESSPGVGGLTGAATRPAAAPVNLTTASAAAWPRCRSQPPRASQRARRALFCGCAMQKSSPCTSGNAPTTG